MTPGISEQYYHTLHIIIHNTHLLVSLMEGMYSKTWIVEQWLRRSIMPRNPEEGGVGSKGQAVIDCNQFQIDHRDPDSIVKDNNIE